MSMNSTGYLGDFLVGLLVVAVCAGPASPVHGQEGALDFSGKSTDQRPDLLERRPMTDSPRLKLPPPPPPAKDEPGFSARPSVAIREIVVTGSTVYSEAEIGRVTGPYENRALTMADLESLRRDLTLLYVNQGYINSGAVLPDQDLTDGRLIMQIVEGRLTAIEVTGNDWFGTSFLRARVALAAGVPVNLRPLQERLQLLQQDQRIELIHAELRPGTRPGEAELAVQVEENPPLSIWLGANNYQSPTVGAERGLATLSHQNLTGHADTLSLTYGYSEGIDPLLDLWYQVPVTVQDTTLLCRYRKNDARVVDKTFGELEIVSTSEGYEFSLRHPVHRTLSQEFALACSGEYQRNETTMFGEKFTFVIGADNGRTVVVPLRCSQEWTFRTQREVLAARSRFSLGIDALDATINQDEDVADGRFFAWLGQLQWARILPWRDTQVIARADYQWTRDPLLPVEQMALGGRYTVRGYRENLLVRDRAFIAALEARLPLPTDESWVEYLQLVPFLDYGRGVNVGGEPSGPEEISSIGLGLRWGADLFSAPYQQKAEAEIFYGYRLRDLDRLHDDIQDNGIHFQVALTALF